MPTFTSKILLMVLVFGLLAGLVGGLVTESFIGVLVGGGLGAVAGWFFGSNM